MNRLTASAGAAPTRSTASVSAMTDDVRAAAEGMAASGALAMRVGAREGEVKMRWWLLLPTAPSILGHPSVLRPVPGPS